MREPPRQPSYTVTGRASMLAVLVTAAAGESSVLLLAGITALLDSWHRTQFRTVRPAKARRDPLNRLLGLGEAVMVSVILIYATMMSWPWGLWVGGVSTLALAAVLQGFDLRIRPGSVPVGPLCWALATLGGCHAARAASLWGAPIAAVIDTTVFLIALGLSTWLLRESRTAASTPPTAVVPRPTIGFLLLSAASAMALVLASTLPIPDQEVFMASLSVLALGCLLAHRGSITGVRYYAPALLCFAGALVLLGSAVGSQSPALGVATWLIPLALTPVVGHHIDQDDRVAWVRWQRLVRWAAS